MPSQSVAAPAAELAMDGALADELWQLSEAAACGLERADFLALLREEAARVDTSGAALSRSTLGEHFRALRLADLVLARACAQGGERAWERFLALYRQPLIRAAIAITGSEPRGRDLADQLYAELYGLSEREGQRRSPLATYRGRGSLLGWLRTTLAQRHVDHHRRTYRERPLDDGETSIDPPAAEVEAEPATAQLAALRQAVRDALTLASAEDRLLLAAYYLDGRKLHQIAAVLGVHEATISRKLKRAAEWVHKQILHHLQETGLSRRAAEEALEMDPRDVEMDVKSWLQAGCPQTFQEEARE